MAKKRRLHGQRTGPVTPVTVKKSKELRTGANDDANSVFARQPNPDYHIPPYFFFFNFLVFLRPSRRRPSYSA